MGNLLLKSALITTILFQVPAMSIENKKSTPSPFHFTLRDNSVSLLTYSASAIVLTYAAEKILFGKGSKPVNGFWGLLTVGSGFMIYPTAGIVGATAASHASDAITNGFAHLDKDAYNKEFNKLVAFNKSVDQLDTIPTDKKYQKLLKKFKCNTCASDLEKAQELVKMFNDIESLAKEKARKNKLTDKQLNSMFQDKGLDIEISKLVRGTASQENFDLAIRFFALSFIRHM